MKNKILIIEDDIEISDMLNDYLSKNNYDTSIARDGINGIKIAKENNPDLIILDIMLPYKSGDQILKEVRQFSSIPIIIISAKDMISTKIDLLKLGADDYITKPFDLGEVIARIESNLRRYSISAFQTSLFTYKDISLDENTKEVKITEIPIMDRYSNGSYVIKDRILSSYNIKGMETYNDKEKEDKTSVKVEKSAVSLKEIDDKLSNIDSIINDSYE